MEHEHSIEDENLPPSHCQRCGARAVDRSNDDGSDPYRWCEVCDEEVKI